MRNRFEIISLSVLLLALCLGCSQKPVTLPAEVRWEGSHFVIINQGQEPWTNVKVQLNGNGWSGWEWRADTIKPGFPVPINPSQFTLPSGERFNVRTHAIQTVGVYADTPQGRGSYVGEFKP